MGKEKKEKEGADFDVDTEKHAPLSTDVHSSHKHKKKKKKEKRSSDSSDDSRREEKEVVKHEHKDGSKTKKKKKKKRERHETSSESDEKECKGKKKKCDTAVNQESEEEEEKVHEKPVSKGQYSNANFEDSDRQEKFFRLMGGYKKKDDNKSNTHSKLSNRLMTKSEEKNMEERLETQYSHALEKKKTGRGMGLGYHAETDPNVKDFHIDKDKVKSIKFEAATE